MKTHGVEIKCIDLKGEPNEPHHDQYRPAHLQQRLHDVCLVRAFEVAGDESYLQLASLCRYFVLVRQFRQRTDFIGPVNSSQLRTL